MTAQTERIWGLGRDEVIGHRANGRPIYLMQGGSAEGDGENGGNGNGPPGDDATGSFPASTPWREMTVPQQAAYWQHQSRKHEGRATAASGLLGKLGVTDDASVQALIEKRDRAEALANDLATDTQRAAREAREAATTEVTATMRAQSVEDAFRLLVGDRKTDDETTDFLGDLNLTRFIGQNGRVDTAKVHARVEQFAPATGSSTTSTKAKGPTVTGIGAVTRSDNPGEAGKAALERIFGKK